MAVVGHYQQRINFISDYGHQPARRTSSDNLILLSPLLNRFPLNQRQRTSPYLSLHKLNALIFEVVVFLIVFAGFRLSGGQEDHISLPGHVAQKLEDEEIGEFIGCVEEGEDEAEERDCDEDGFGQRFRWQLVHEY